MWGRFFGVAAGLVLVGEGVLLWRPQVMGALPTPDLGPFTEYRLLVAGLAAAVGMAVILASLQREGAHARRAKASGPAFEWTPAAAEAASAPTATPVFHPAPEVQPAAQPQIAPEPPPPAPEPQPAPPPAVAAVEELAPFPAAPVEVAALEPAPAPPPVPEPVVMPVLAPAPAPVESPPLAPALGPASDRARFLELTDQGHQLRAAGRLDDALEPYGQALAIARGRAATEGDGAAQRDLATALTNLADVYDRDGRIETAISLHEESLGLRRVLAAGSPEDLAAQRALSVGLERLADARDARGHRSRARDLFRERLGLAERLAGQAPTDTALAYDVASTRERLQELDQHLAL